MLWLSKSGLRSSKIPGISDLHDGSVETLLDVLTITNPDDQHGVTSHLTTQQLEALVVYMLSLPGR